MIIHTQTFRNHRNEFFRLKIEKISNQNNHFRITLSLDSSRLRCRLPLILASLIIISCGLWLLQFLTSLVWITSTLGICWLIYFTNPLIEVLFDNIQGIEYEKQYWIGYFSGREFFKTNNIAINEMITMRKIIFCLVAVPNEFKDFVFASSNQARPIEEEEFGQTKLVPLFIETLPRLDCLKVIYNYIEKIRSKSDNFDR
ncbi:hypothetical protein SSS_10541 [Sarcoptes scabiei]|nr:hypothetical protein SSS_10541 [Sarcoptes scabiei]